MRETLESILSLSSFTRPVKAVYRTHSSIGSVCIVCTLIKKLKDNTSLFYLYDGGENKYIDRLQLTSSPPCWMTINKIIIISSIVPVIQHGRQGLCHLNLTRMIANHQYDISA